MRALLARALQLMVVYLVDEHVPFINLVHAALRQLLHKKEGEAAMQQLDPLQQSYLQVFAGSKSVTSVPEAGTRCT